MLVVTWSRLEPARECVYWTLPDMVESVQELNHDNVSTGTSPELTGPSTLPGTSTVRQARDMTIHETATTETLAVSDCWALLRDSVVGRLAIVAGGEPDIFPVNHIVDHGSIVFRTAAGTKLATAVRHQVAFEVDGYDADDATAWSVVAKGTAHEISEMQESIRAMDLPLYPWHDGPKPHFVRIEPTSVTGRRLHIQGGFREASGDLR